MDAPIDDAVDIPVESLSPEALRGVIEEFILREGTDYGWRETSHDAKISSIRGQLDKGEIRIVFDPQSESVTLVERRNTSKKL